MGRCGDQNVSVVTFEVLQPVRSTAWNRHVRPATGPGMFTEKVNGAVGVVVHTGLQQTGSVEVDAD